MKILDNRIEFVGLVKETPWARFHLAKDIELSRSLLVVEIKKPTFAHDKDVRGYVRAAHNLSQVSHTNIRQVLGVKQGEDGTLFIVSEQQSGAMLGRIFGPLATLGFPPEIAYAVVAQAARGLAAVHDAKDRQSAQAMSLFHLGLNPETIWLAESGTVRLGEFQYPPDKIRDADQVAYLAPEQIQAGQADQRTDMFSLGVIAYELICGTRLFPSRNVSELMATILRGEYDLSAMRSTKADARLIDLVDICVRLNKSDRLVTASQMADRADALVRESGIDTEKRIRELVEKVSENPKLDTYPAGRKERVRTRSVNRTDLDEGNQGMVEQSRSGRDDDKRPRAGQETRISSTPVSERIKRAKRSGLGGNKTIFALGIVAAILLIVVGALTVRRLMQNTGTDDVPTAGETKTGTLSTLPAGAAVYSADSLIGYSPVVVGLAEGDLVTLKHPCCPDSAIVLNYDRLAEAPYVLMTSVEITSNPVGAKLTLNGQPVAESTPYQFAASATDTIQFMLELPGKTAISSGPVVLADFATLDIKNISASRRSQGGIQFSGSFVERPMTSIVSVPSGAIVSIAATGEELGQTPFKKDLGDEALMLRISKEGLEDKMLDLPAFGSRKGSYKEYLFRRVDVRAHEDGNPSKLINAKIREVTYDGKTVSATETTPASIRLPGIDCSIVVAADGYENANVVVPGSSSEFDVAMRKRDSGGSPKPETKPQEDNSAKSEVRIFVVDDKKSPVAGALVIAEFKKGKEKQLLDLGRTDADGRVVGKLEAGKYKFTASHDNYKDNDESKDVKVGEQYVLTIKVKRR